MPGSIDRVETQLAVGALVAVIRALGLEDGAVGHVAGVDVQADSDDVVAGVADRVVFVWRDEAARRAWACLDRADGLEAIEIAFRSHLLVLHDFQRAAPHAFHAPHAAVIVDRCALAGTPGHGDHAVAVIVAVIKLATGVATFCGFEHTVGQGDFFVANQLAEAVAKTVSDSGRGAFGNRFVDRVD